MVNLDLTIFFWKGEPRWRLEVGRLKMPFDACIKKMNGSVENVNKTDVHNKINNKIKMKW